MMKDLGYTNKIASGYWGERSETLPSGKRCNSVCTADFRVLAFFSVATPKATVQVSSKSVSNMKYHKNIT